MNPIDKTVQTSNKKYGMKKRYERFILFSPSESVLSRVNHFPENARKNLSPRQKNSKIRFVSYS